MWLNSLLAIRAEAEEQEEKKNGTCRPAEVPRGEGYRLSVASDNLFDSPRRDLYYVEALSPQNLKRIYSILDQAKREERITAHGERDSIVPPLQDCLRAMYNNGKEPAAAPTAK